MAGGKSPSSSKLIVEGSVALTGSGFGLATWVLMFLAVPTVVEGRVLQVFP